MRGTILLAVLLAAPALAEDRPHRPIPVERQSTAPLAEVQACMAKWGKPMGRPIVMPLDGGVALDLQPGFLMGGGEPMFTIEIRDRGEVRGVTLLYRHPYNENFTVKFLKNAAKKCGLGDEVALAEASGSE